MLLTLLTCIQLETITNNIQKNFTLTQTQRTELISQVRQSAPPTCWPMKRAEDPVTFVGDSITAFNNWQAAFPERITYNQGVPGDTSYHIAVRANTIKSTGAKTYIMMMGINDILWWKFDPQNIRDRIVMIRDYLKSTTGSRVVVQSTITCTRSLCGSESLNKVNELNRLLRDRIPKEDFLDINTVLSDRNGLRPEYTYDGIHLNAIGYSVWQQKLRSSGLL
jgi:lysophospholipase L1-like esterase